MDLKTENHIATILMQEAKKLRLKAEREGVHVYLRQPKVRGCPNSHFLTSTVLGVQQANRAAEVNEMWKIRNKELELDKKLMGGPEDNGRGESPWNRDDSSERNSSPGYEQAEGNAVASLKSSKRINEDLYSDEDGGLRDEDVDEFLRSRVKRGRGAVGSRMDEPGATVPVASSSGSKGKTLENSDLRVGETWEQNVFGPEGLAFSKYRDSVRDLFTLDRMKNKEVDAVKSRERSLKSRERSLKNRHRAKGKSRKEKKGKRKDKKSRHR